ncbi:MAG: NAD-dependent epimerase/dehydratase family protein [Bacteroidales bacterium]|jgi:UDP-2-acetamido-2,6-beta-L-arabino-hexul-4-ose reductase|nr:NAD-dependent epimerase/dehydratase family protein [Bacteroidales bacterium]
MLKDDQKKICVGITGQAGFIGSILFNTINHEKSIFQAIPFEDNYFQDPVRLQEWVFKCDTIVHLAALNRHDNPEFLFETNVQLVKLLISAIEKTKSKAHIIFSSSSQEERDNAYGRSKKEGRSLFEQWSRKSNTCFTGMVIPNVFGPFGLPYYNSVVATFSHQLTHNEQPKIDTDSNLKLIYSGDLVEEILKIIKERRNIPYYFVPYSYEKTVSEILEILLRFKSDYLNKSVFPKLESYFEIDLFNTFRSYIDISSHFPRKFIKLTDNRGSFVETLRLLGGGQVSFSSTNPGITRGNHYHTRKIERFAVIKGRARIELRRIGTSDVITFILSGDEPGYVDIPIWYTHNLTNIGTDDLFTIFWVNEFFDEKNPDTYFENVIISN